MASESRAELFGTPVEETEQRLMPAPTRGVIVGASLTAGAVVLLGAAYATGRLGTIHAAAHHATDVAGTQSPVQLMWRLLVAVAVIGTLATTCGALAGRIGQPPVVGEIVAGLILGPSVVGSLTPGLFHAILPPQVLPNLNLLAQAGLAIFMFTVGADFDQGVLRRQRKIIAAASLSMMAVPFALGVLAAIPLYALFAGRSVGPVPFAVFVGTALSVTAFPVLARIVQDSGLRGTRLGSLAMVCAAVADVLAWCALAVVLAMIRAQGTAAVLRALALTVALCAVCLLLLRPLVRALATRYADAAVPDPTRVLMVLVLILGLAAATDRIGIHAIFGGFLAGLVLPTGTRLLSRVSGQIGALNRALLVPVFFASIGLQTDVRLAVTQPLVLAGGALLLLTAIAGKFCSAVPVAWAGGMPARQALGLGVLMNARGITEIVVLSTGLSAGVINRSAFTVLVVMALVTTVMAAPALRLLGLSRHAPAGPRAPDGSIGEALPAAAPPSGTALPHLPR
jgi:Kef-type K+ transport system membrane component KefB